MEFSKIEILESIQQVIQNDGLFYDNKKNQIEKIYLNLDDEQKRELYKPISDIIEGYESFEGYFDSVDLLFLSDTDTQRKYFLEFIKEFISGIEDALDFKGILDYMKKEYIPNIKEEIVNENTKEIYKLLKDRTKESEDDYRVLFEAYMIDFITFLYNRMDNEYKSNHINELFDIIYENIYDEEKNNQELQLGVDLYDYFKNLDTENQLISFDKLIEWIMNKDTINDKNGLITYIWDIIKGEVQLEKLDKVINAILESDNDIKIKKENIMQILMKVDKDAILEDFEKYVSQIEKINNDIDKADIYYNVLNIYLKENNPEEFDRITDIVMENLKKEEKYKNLDFSSREKFINDLIFLNLTDYGVEKWDEKDETEKINIEKRMTSIIKQDFNQAIKNDAIFNLYDAIVHGRIECSDEFKETLEKMANDLPYPEKFEGYGNIIESGNEINENEIDDFLNNVELYRIKNGKIPKKYYDYIIKETIMGNIDCTNRVIKEAIVDFGLDYLDKLDIKYCLLI